MDDQQLRERLLQLAQALSDSALSVPPSALSLGAFARCLARTSSPLLLPATPFAIAQFDEFLDQVVSFSPYFSLKEGVQACLTTVDKMLGGVKSEFIHGDSPTINDLLLYILNSLDDVTFT